MSVEPLNNELIKYENIGISFENKKVLSGFNLSCKEKTKNPFARKIRDRENHSFKNVAGLYKACRGYTLLSESGN